VVVAGGVVAGADIDTATFEVVGAAVVVVVARVVAADAAGLSSFLSFPPSTVPRIAMTTSTAATTSSTFPTPPFFLGRFRV
jgi:hypothetical protein